MKYLLLLTCCTLLTSCGSKTYVERPVVVEKPAHYNPPVIIEREKTIKK